MIRLNVIGQKEQKNISDLLLSHALFVSLCTTVGICTITIFILFIGRAYFNISLASVTDELSRTKIVSPSGETLSVLELTDKINEELAVVEPLINNVQYDTVLIDLGKTMPNGISFTSVSVTASNSALVAQGFAASRNDVPVLESNLKKLPYLTGVVIESSLNERTHVPVSISATIDRTRFNKP